MIELRKDDCVYDCISLGEVMLRLDPGEGRISTAREFKVWEGGGEYNVTRGLRKCFGKTTACVTSFVDNAVGHLIEDFMMQGGVDTRFIKWVSSDGSGTIVRNGLNFTERGFGIRGALGVPDRSNTAASKMKTGDFDWNLIFGKYGSRWFHTGGIFAALSNTTAELIVEAVKVAKRHGTIVSYDLNYRPSLWNPQGGQEKARRVNKELVKYVDVLIGNEEDFFACLGIESGKTSSDFSVINIDDYSRMIDKVVSEYPNLKVIATTLRTVNSASNNDWQAICWCDGKVSTSRLYKGLEVLDRVGGGDSFASGLVYGLLESMDCSDAVEYGAAHGALCLTTPGDTSMSTLSEVKRLVNGGNARIIR